jgi:hypothetical protein
MMVHNCARKWRQEDWEFGKAWVKLGRPDLRNKIGTKGLGRSLSVRESLPGIHETPGSNHISTKKKKEIISKDDCTTQAADRGVLTNHSRKGNILFR